MRTDRPLTLTVTEAGNLLGVSRSTAYELVRTGELDSVQLRRRVVVPVAAIAERLGITVPDVWLALDVHGQTLLSASRVAVPVTGRPYRVAESTAGWDRWRNGSEHD